MFFISYFLRNEYSLRKVGGKGREKKGADDFRPRAEFSKRI